MNRLYLWFLAGLCLILLLNYVPPELRAVDSFQTADSFLREQILPKIEVETASIPDEIAVGYDVRVQPLQTIGKMYRDSECHWVTLKTALTTRTWLDHKFLYLSTPLHHKLLHR